MINYYLHVNLAHMLPEGPVFDNLIKLEEVADTLTREKYLTNGQRTSLWNRIRKDPKLAKSFVDNHKVLSDELVETILLTERRKPVLNSLLNNNPVGGANKENIRKSYQRLDPKLQAKLLVDGTFSFEEGKNLLEHMQPEGALIWFACVGEQHFTKEESLSFLVKYLTEVRGSGRYIREYIVAEYPEHIKSILRQNLMALDDATRLGEMVLGSSAIKDWSAEDLYFILKNISETCLLLVARGHLDYSYESVVTTSLSGNDYFNYLKYRKAVLEEAISAELIYDCVRRDYEPWMRCQRFTRESMKTCPSWYSEKSEFSSLYFIKFLPAYKEVVGALNLPQGETRAEVLVRHEQVVDEMRLAMLEPIVDCSDFPIANGYYRTQEASYIIDGLKDQRPEVWNTFFLLLPNYANSTIGELLKAVKALA